MCGKHTEELPFSYTLSIRVCGVSAHAIRRLAYSTSSNRANVKTPWSSMFLSNSLEYHHLLQPRRRFLIFISLADTKLNEYNNRQNYVKPWMPAMENEIGRGFRILSFSIQNKIEQSIGRTYYAKSHVVRATTRLADAALQDKVHGEQLSESKPIGTRQRAVLKVGREFWILSPKNTNSLPRNGRKRRYTSGGL
jgi:hypothetical protein